MNICVYILLVFLINEVNFMILNYFDLNYYCEKNYYKLIFDINFGFVIWLCYYFIKGFLYLKGYVCLEFNWMVLFEFWNFRGWNWMNMVYLVSYLD